MPQTAVNDNDIQSLRSCLVNFPYRTYPIVNKAFIAPKVRSLTRNAADWGDIAFSHLANVFPAGAGPASICVCVNKLVDRPKNIPLQTLNWWT